MTRARVLISCTTMVLAVAVFASPALGGSQEPGLLRASDLPGAVRQVGDEPRTDTTVNLLVVDGDACTQTIEADEAATEFTGVQFAAVATGDAVLVEVVIAYPNAKAAKAAFKVRTASARAGVRCGSVENVIEGVPPSSVTYDAVKFPKVGNRSHAVARSAASSEEAAVGVEFVSGRYLVIVNTVGNADGPSVKQLKPIVRQAQKRLAGGN